MEDIKYFNIDYNLIPLDVYSTIGKFKLRLKELYGELGEIPLRFLLFNVKFIKNNIGLNSASYSTKGINSVMPRDYFIRLTDIMGHSSDHYINNFSPELLTVLKHEEKYLSSIIKTTFKKD